MRLLLVSDEDGFLYGDSGRLKHLPAGRGAPSEVIVSGPGTVLELANRYGKPGDILGGSAPGVPSELKRDKTSIIKSEEAWGYCLDPQEAADWWRGADEFAASEGIKLGKTASSLPRALLAKYYVPRKPLTASLQALALDCVHQGPQVLCAAHLPFAREHDLRSAYLWGAREMLPADKYAPAEHMAVDRLLRRDGFGRFLVKVPSRFPADIGPLPLRGPFGLLWPVGKFVATCTIALLRNALELGCELLAVDEAYTSSTKSRALEQVADHIDRWPEPFRKLAYTRLYGVLCSSRWYEAPFEQELDASGHPTVARAWERTSRELGEIVKPWFRPDLSAHIAGHAAIKMVQGAVSVRKAGGQVGYAHVDALWHNAPEWALDEKDWKVKREGEFFGYSVGVYEHAGRFKASGVESEFLTEQRIAELRATTSVSTRASRYWFRPGEAVESLRSVSGSGGGMLGFLRGYFPCDGRDAASLPVLLGEADYEK